MAVAFDAVGPSSSGQAGAGGATSVSWTHTAGAGAGTALVWISVGIDAGQTAALGTCTCTYGGNAMTLLGSTPANGPGQTAGGIFCFGITGQASGGNAVSATYSSGTSLRQLIGASVSFTGAGSFGTAVVIPSGNPGSAAGATLSITGTTSGNVCAAGICDGSGGEAWTSGTQRFLKDNDTASGAGNTTGATLASPGGTASLTWTQTSDWYGAVGVEVLAAGGAVAAAQPPPPLIPPGFSSPMALTAFMPVPQGGALVSGADTGAGADTGSVAVAVSDADTGTAADTGSVAVAVSDADTGTAADTGSVAVAVSDADTGTGTDAASVLTPAAQPPPPLIPPGFQSPAAFTAFMPVPQGGALVSDSDTGTAADTGSVAVAVSDADTGTAADTGSVAVAVSDADTAVAADTGSVAVAVSDADTGTGTDAASVVTAAPQPPPPLIPPGFSSPMALTAFMPVPQGAATGAAVSDTDTGSAADTGSVAVAVSDADTAAGTDTGTVTAAVTGTDTGTGADTGSVAVAVSDADTASGADTGSVAVVVPPVPPPPPAIPPGFASPMAFTAFQPPRLVAAQAAARPGSVAITDAPAGTVAISNE